MTIVPAGTNTSVFRGVSCTAEEEGLPLEAAFPPHHGEGWKDVVDLRVYHLALHLQPEGRNRRAKVSDLSLPGLITRKMFFKG